MKINVFKILTGVAMVAVILYSCGGKTDTAEISGNTETASDSYGTRINLNFPMIFVEGGTFTMGCTPEQEGDCMERENPAHTVTVSDFLIGKYEVTQRQWAAVMGNNPSGFRGDDLPIESVSWNNVQEFIARLNTLSGRNFRLPTEAEWEYAARGGNRSLGFKYSGSNSIGDVAWYYENSGDNALNERDWADTAVADGNLERNNNRTHPVGSKRANELGIHDMSGNVWEWVYDLFGDYSSSAKTNPIGTSPDSINRRVTRGGCWSVSADGNRVSIRGRSKPDVRYSNLGFRLAHPPMNDDNQNTENYVAETQSTMLTDSRDGKTYRTVQIGNQTWMAENLDFTTSSGSWCYNNSNDNCNTYGRLYNWATAMRACPAGWHLPSVDEWTALVEAVGGVATAGTKLKSSIGWQLHSSIPIGTDDHGFSALPGGYYLEGSFGNVGYNGLWWTATEYTATLAHIRRLFNRTENVDSYWGNKTFGLSVRCVRD